MLVIIRNAPDTAEGRRGVKVARDMAADVALIQNGVYFMQEDRLEDLGFCGTAYVLTDDRRLRGLREKAQDKRVKEVTYDGLVDLMAESDRVIGMF